jgi:anti-anti-sigma factor
MSPSCSDPILNARLPDGIVIIRVIGKGTHQQTSNLLHVFQVTRDQAPPPSYVIDLDQCTTMDSTFMGTLARIGLHQRRERGTSVVLTNIKEHVRYLLNTLGLHYILDLRPDRGKVAESVASEDFTPAAAPEMSHLDRIVMMIEAHERLIDVDGENEIKFESVLKSLRDSLAREQQRGS